MDAMIFCSSGMLLFLSSMLLWDEVARRRRKGIWVAVGLMSVAAVTNIVSTPLTGLLAVVFVVAAAGAGWLTYYAAT